VARRSPYRRLKKLSGEQAAVWRASGKCDGSQPIRNADCKSLERDPQREEPRCAGTEM
jgi:hypothetical protein